MQIIHYENKPIVGGAAWRKRVADMIRDGFGCEDIALKLDSRLDDVRSEIKRLRMIGALKAWWPRA